MSLTPQWLLAYTSKHHLGSKDDGLVVITAVICNLNFKILARWRHRFDDDLEHGGVSLGLCGANCIVFKTIVA